MSKSYNSIPYSLVEKLFVIDSSSKTGIAWKKNARPAGTVLPSGYCQVRVPSSDKNLFVHTHRIVWMLAKKKDIPDESYHVDHLDFDRTNNRPENLRLIKRYWNISRRQDKKSDGLPSNIYKKADGNFFAQFSFEGKGYRHDDESVQKCQEWLDNKRAEVIGIMEEF